MLPIHRIVLRDAESRALLLTLPLEGVETTIEGTGTSLRVTDAGGAPLVELPVAHLALLEHAAIHYVGAGHIRGSRELRSLRVALELR